MPAATWYRNNQKAVRTRGLWSRGGTDVVVAEAGGGWIRSPRGTVTRKMRTVGTLERCEGLSGRTRAREEEIKTLTRK